MNLGLNRATLKRRYEILRGLGLYRLGFNRKKVFSIGFNKTGTTSLHALFVSLGLSSYHGTAWRHSGRNFRYLVSYDCFSDGPPDDFIELDKLFPKSKFILQVRELDGWVYSRLAHIARKKQNGTWQYRLYWNNTKEDVLQWIKQRNEHHMAVMAYFDQRPEDLLVVNFIRDPEAAAKICRFLGFAERPARPQENIRKARSEPLAHTNMLKECLHELGIPEGETKLDILAPSLLSDRERNLFAPDTNQLSHFLGLG